MKAPGRSAAAVLWELMGETMVHHDLPSWNMTGSQRVQLAALLRSGIASPWTTSMGRLFDAVASLTGLCQQASFEGQAAMAVQFAAEREWEVGGGRIQGYPIDLVSSERSDAKWMVDWRSVINAVLDDLRRGVSFM
jgi:hydrogenase maturation protein HypF